VPKKLPESVTAPASTRNAAHSPATAGRSWASSPDSAWIRKSRTVARIEPINSGSGFDALSRGVETAAAVRCRCGAMPRA
jgi:hypothetical protein